MSNDVLITPASRKIEFKDSSANVDAKIETDSSGNLVITNAGGDISIGDTTSDIFVGDGTNNIDIVFEQDGEIRGTTGVTVTLGATDSNVRMATDLNLNSNDITNVGDLTVTGNLTVTGTTTTLETATLSVEDKNITLNYGSGDTSGSANGAGITIQDAVNSTTDATILWDASNDHWQFSHDLQIPTNIRHTGDLDNYIGFSTDTQGFITGNSTRMQITNSLVRFNQENANQDFSVYSSNSNNMLYVDASADSVGIGTDTPVGTFEIYAAEPRIHLNRENNFSWNIWVGNGTTFTNSFFNIAEGTNSKFTIAHTTGNVGIGTSSPGAALHVYDDRDITANNEAKGIRLSESSGDWLLSLGISGVTNTGFAIRDNALDTYPFVIRETSGNVGIGTTSPSNKLDVSGHIEAGSFEFNAVSGTAVHGTGLRVPASQTMALHTNSAERMRIDSSGRVGIGTTSPNNKLTVSGASDGINIIGTSSFIRWNSGDMMIRNEGSYAMGFHTYDGSSAMVERMRIDSSGDLTIQGGRIYLKESDLGNNAVAITRDADEGYLQLFSSGSQTVELRGNGNSYINGGNVGIGTSSPSQKLDVAGHININTPSGASQSGYALKLNKTNSSSQVQLGAELLASPWASNTNGGNLSIKTANSVGTATTAMTIDGAQNVGIGTTSPSTALEVIGDIKIKQGSGYSNYSLIDASEALLTLETYSNNLSVHPGDIIFKPAGTERMRVTDDGNVGINTNAPGYKLHIKETGTNAGAAYFEDGTSWLRVVPNLGSGGFNPMSATGDIGLIFSSDNDNSTDSGTLGLLIAPHSANAGGIKICEDGDVGIGTTTPASPLHVNGNVQVGVGNSKEAFIQATNSGRVASNPAYSFNGDVDTGMFNPDTDNTIAFATGGSERVRIDSSGRVGIGTTSPDKLLDVLGDIRSIDGSNNQHQLRATQVISYGTDAILNAQSTGDDVRLNTQSTTRLIATAEGNVGIGVTDPDAKLEVNGTTKLGTSSYSAGVDTITDGALIIPQGARIVSQNPSNEYLRTIFTHETSNGHYIFGQQSTSLIGDMVFYPGSSGNIRFFTSGSEDIRFTSAGDVGIGTTNPQGTLHLRDTTARLYVQSDDGSSAHVTFGDATDVSRGGIEYTSTDDLIFSNNNFAERMRLRYTGDVGIGLSLPDSKLHIEQDAVEISTTNLDNGTAVGLHVTMPDAEITSGTVPGVAIGLGMNGRGRSYLVNTHVGTNKDASELSIYTETGGTISEQLIIKHDGKVGIGTSSPTAKLEVNGGIKASGSSYFNGSVSLSSGGQLSGSFLVGDGWEFEGADYSIVFDGTANALEWQDNAKATFGTGNDLQIYHDGTNVISASSGNIVIDQNTDDGFITLRADDGSGGIASYFQIDGTNEIVKSFKDFNVTGNADISGNLTVDDTLTIGDATANSNSFILFGERLAATETNKPFIGQTNSGNGTSQDLGLGVHSSSGTVKIYAGNVARFSEGAVRLKVANDHINFTEPLQMGGTEFLSDARNLSNIGTISSGAITTTGDIDLTGVSNTADEIIKLPRGGRIAFYGDGSLSHAISSMGTDDIRINSYGEIILNLDSNDNQTSAASFRIIKHGGGSSAGTSVFTIDGENGNATFTGDISTTTGTIQINGNDVIDDSRNLTNIATMSVNALGSPSVFSVLSSGNTEIAGTLQVESNTTLNGDLSVSGSDLTVTGGLTDLNKSRSSTSDAILELHNTNSTNYNGQYFQIRDHNGTVRGTIGTRSETNINMYINGGGTGLKFLSYITYKAILPVGSDGSDSDNTTDLGSSTVRFDDIYATNGTIQTSDRNEKQDIQALTEAERRVATACKGLIRRFRWQDSVAEKDDNPDSDETARYHFGVIAQDLQAAFTAEGLDAGDYGMFISSTWTDDDGVEQTRLGVRYNELLAFIIATL